MKNEKSDSEGGRTATTARPAHSKPLCPLCGRILIYAGWLNREDRTKWECEACHKTIEIFPFVPSEARMALLLDVSEVDSAQRVVAAELAGEAAGAGRAHRDTAGIELRRYVQGDGEESAFLWAVGSPGGLWTHHESAKYGGKGWVRAVDAERLAADLAGLRAALDHLQQLWRARSDALDERAACATTLDDLATSFRQCADELAAVVQAGAANQEPT